MNSHGPSDTHKTEINHISLPTKQTNARLFNTSGRVYITGYSFN